MMDDNDNDTIELSDTLKWVYPACKFYLKHRYAACNQTSVMIIGSRLKKEKILFLILDHSSVHDQSVACQRTWVKNIDTSTK